MFIQQYNISFQKNVASFIHLFVLSLWTYLTGIFWRNNSQVQKKKLKYKTKNVCLCSCVTNSGGVNYVRRGWPDTHRQTHLHTAVRDSAPASTIRFLLGENSGFFLVVLVQRKWPHFHVLSMSKNTILPHHLRSCLVQPVKFWIVKSL